MAWFAQYAEVMRRISVPVTRMIAGGMCPRRARDRGQECLCVLHLVKCGCTSALMSPSATD